MSDTTTLTTEQVLRMAYEDSTESLRVSGSGLTPTGIATEAKQDDLIADFAAVVSAGKVNVALDSDIQIGAVELKNATTDDRANISDADTARATTDKVLLVQHLDASGLPLSSNIAQETGGNLADVADNTNAIGDGLTPYFDADGDNTAQALKGSAGKLYKLHVYNSNSTVAFVQIFDAAVGDVTVGTTTPVYVLFVPPEAGTLEDFTFGLTFSTAITYACTTTATGGGDPTTGLMVSGGYR